MIINICSGGNVIHITNNAKGYRVSVAGHESFGDVEVGKGELNKAIYSIIDRLERA